MSTISTAFVLVHGAWHGGWCYARVAKLLRLAGHEVYVPTLTGLGERSHLYNSRINLTTHIDDILSLLRFEQLHNIVLVGHSYGGMVITGVADRRPDLIRSLVYLDAFIPGDNQSLHDLVPSAAALAQTEMANESNEFRVAPVPAELFGVNEHDRSWVDSLCTPQPLLTLKERLSFRGGWSSIRKKTYILATNKTAAGGFAVFYDKVAKDPSWNIDTLPSGHDVMIDMPSETAALIVRAAEV